MASTTERLTPRRGHGTITEYKLASVKVYAGTLLATNTSGYVGPVTSSTFATNLIGVAEETVDNTGGAAGDKVVRVRRGCAFKFANAGSNAVAQSHVGAKAGILDDVTINNGTGAVIDPGASIARVEGIDDDGGVWVFIQ